VKTALEWLKSCSYQHDGVFAITVSDVEWRDTEHEQAAQLRIAEARAAAFREAAAIARRDDDAKGGWGELIATDIEEAAKR